MPRYLGRNRIGFCQRTGFKVKHKDLVPDGELSGHLVEKGWEDEDHPQKYLPQIQDREVRSIPGVLVNIEPEEEVELGEPLVTDTTGNLVEE